MKRQATYQLQPIVNKGFKKRKTVPVTGRRRNANARTGGFIGLEKKFVDRVLTSSVLTNVWTTGEHDPATTGLSPVAQGDGESNRDGRRYEIHSIQITGFVQTTSQKANSIPPADVVVRIALVLDKQTNAAQIAAENVFTVAAVPDTDGYRNLQFIERFQVLKEKRFKLNLTAATTNEGAVDSFSCGAVKHLFKMSYKWKTPLKVNMKDTTAVISNVLDNSLHVIAVADNLGTVPLLTYTSRLRFTG